MGTGNLAIQGATLEWIAADAFTVDKSYDRPLNEDRVNSLAQKWKDGAIGVVFASRRPGEERLYLLDGQHRVGALKKLGRKTDLVPTLVFEGLTVAEEAELFVLMNKNRRALLPSELFQASLVEGDKGALEIQAVFDDLGLTLVSLSTVDPKAVRCVATIWRVYRAMGAAGVDATLSLILVTWGDPPPMRAFDQNLVAVLARILFFGEGKVDIERLRTTLARETPDALVSRANSIRSLQGGDKNRILADVILAQYNKGLPKNKEIPSEIIKKRGGDAFTKATHFERHGTQKGGR